MIRDVFVKREQRYGSWVNFTRIFLLALIYYISGQASFSVSVSHSIVTLVIFAAEGFSLAAILLWGYRVWPGIFIGQFILATVNNLSPELAAGISLINSIEAISAYFLVKYFKLDMSLTHLKDVLGLVGIIFLVLQVFSASLGVSLLWYVGSVEDSEFGISWFSWWFGNSMGQLLIAPLILTLASDSFKRHILFSRFIFISMLIIFLLFSFFILMNINNIVLVFTIVIPMLILISRVGGMVVSTLTTAMIATIVIFVSSHGLGPFVQEGQILLLELNLFLLGSALASLFIAVLFSERYLFEQEQQQYIDIIDNYVLTLSTDLNGRILKVSQAYCKVTDYLENELVGQNYKILRHPETPQSVHEAMLKTLTAGQTWHGEIQNQAKDGGTYWLSANISPSYDNKGKHVGYTAVSENITARKIVEIFSVTDQLTKLYNRHKLNEVFTYEIEHSTRYQNSFAVIVIDIDFFKIINDCFGHQQGDEFLKSFARILSCSVRSVDTLCRWGGEEFLIICPETEKEGALALANKIRQTIENNEFAVVGKKTCSIGVTEFIIGDTPESMFKRADSALYEAKQSGRNRVEFQ